ncbi:geranylgeranyl transferase type-2 subunit alpha [Thozetella sp. PMI_491]|nr:geranylgeranyl transferase type-2 subunit alpha [Thozetella sp. PMI_491]
MASHGIARTARARTAEQRAQELEKIKKYRGLEDEARALVSQNSPYSPNFFQLTTRLLKLNPEYYTIWNVRRRLLISGLLSRDSAGSSHSKALPNSSATATTTASSADSSSSVSATTPPDPAPLTAGKSGTSAEGGDAPTEQADAVGGAPSAQEKDLEILKTELGFTIPLLLEYPKCYWIWGHRRWILLEVIKRLPVPIARRVWEEELGLVAKMLTKDQRNFHAWGYRRLVVKMLESAALEGKSMAESEFEYTTKRIKADLSNFSAWHGRSKLIPRLLDERGADDAARQVFFDDELALIREALNVGPEDQSLWYYHLFLILNLTDYVGRPSITPGLSQEERVSYLTREIEDIKDLLEDYDDVKWIYEALLEYTISLSQLEARPLNNGEKEDLKTWLANLRKNDPMRNGRWDDIAAQYGLE